MNRMWRLTWHISIGSPRDMGQGDFRRSVPILENVLTKHFCIAREKKIGIVDKNYLACRVSDIRLDVIDF
jgi:hypothetical protein